VEQGSLYIDKAFHAGGVVTAIQRMLSMFVVGNGELFILHQMKRLVAVCISFGPLRKISEISQLDVNKPYLALAES